MKELEREKGMEEGCKRERKRKARTVAESEIAREGTRGRSRGGGGRAEERTTGACCPLSPSRNAERLSCWLMKMTDQEQK